MKIFNQKQLQSWDRYTIEVDGLSSLELIEEAGEMLADEIEIQFLSEHTGPIHVYCGLGNNGADGLVLARQLSEFIEDITVFVIMHKPQGSEEFQFYLDVIEEFGVPMIYIHQKDELASTESRNTILIDALLGTGISRPVEGFLGDVIDHINSLECDLKISIDLPSGMHPDLIMNGPIIQADYTLSIAGRKMATLYREHSLHAGKVINIPLPLSHEYYNLTETKNHLIELFDLLPRPKIDEHAYKNEFGHVLFLGGSRGKMGAALLASEAALRAGCGLVTAHVPASGVEIMQVGIPEAMVSVDNDDQVITQLPDMRGYQSICVGCGMSRDVSPQLLHDILQLRGVPKVLDADALNLLADHKNLLDHLDSTCVLTPHIGEFHRLFGNCMDSRQRFEKLIEKSLSLGCFIILKGRYTMIATPSGECYINSTGNPVLGTAGSGDILAGYISGLLAQGGDVLDACCRAVCLHGFAGDLLQDENGSRGSLARDILGKLSGIEVHLEDLIRSFMPYKEDEDILGLDLLENPN
jgi:NAD(P)H-hydrate epimerase